MVTVEKSFTRRLSFLELEAVDPLALCGLRPLSAGQLVTLAVTVFSCPQSSEWRAGSAQRKENWNWATGAEFCLERSACCFKKHCLSRSVEKRWPRLSTSETSGACPETVQLFRDLYACLSIDFPLYGPAATAGLLHGLRRNAE
jgi:hypothetical protein